MVLLWLSLFVIIVNGLIRFYMYRKISISLIAVLVLLSISGYVFSCAHGWLVNTVNSRIDDVVQLVEYGQIQQGASLIKVLEFMPTGKINTEKINLQKAIIESKLGNANNADTYFQQVGNDVIMKSETGRYYQHLIELVNNLDTDVNWTLLPDSFIAEHYNDLSIEQRQTAYRELVLAQILLNISESNLAVFTLEQAIKKAPDYRDAYVLLHSITRDEMLLEEIRKIDPEY